MFLLLVEIFRVEERGRKTNKDLAPKFKIGQKMSMHMYFTDDRIRIHNIIVLRGVVYMYELRLAAKPLHLVW